MEQKAKSMTKLGVLAVAVAAVCIMAGCQGKENEGAPGSSDAITSHDQSSASEQISSESSSQSTDNIFQYYFTFQDLDTKKFNKDLALTSLNDYNRNEVTSLPITYENLSAKFKTYVLSDGKYVDELREASNVCKEEVRWGVNQEECCLRTQFFGDHERPIAEAMAEHAFYVEIGRFSYLKQLGLENPDSKKDFDIILETLGNPNEIYVRPEITPGREKADFWMVYNYNDYMLAFNFTETSYEGRAKGTPQYIAPAFEGGYYIDGNSFGPAINAIKSGIFTKYYENAIEIVIK